MKKIWYIYLFASFGFVSCKGFKSLTTQHSTSLNTGHTKKEPRFLDELSVVPGNNRTILAEPAAALSERKNTIVASPTYDAANFNVIQLKYGMLLDIPFEYLNNLNLLKNIEYWWGTKYCLGGTTENCIDCSAFTMTLERDVFLKEIPRTAAEQFNATRRITKDELKAGDLVFFTTARHRVSHVGVYIANNKFVHASVSNGVMISDLDESYWKQRFVGCGRIED